MRETLTAALSSSRLLRRSSKVSFSLEEGGRGERGGREGGGREGGKGIVETVQ